MQVVGGSQPDVGRAADAAHRRARLADPHRQRCSPIAGARQIPVDQVLQPVAHAPVADVGRLPLDAAVVVEQPLLHRGGADEPRVQRVVEQRGVTTPAERVRVGDPFGPVEQAGVAQVVDDSRVRILDEETAVAGLAIKEPAVEADHVAHRDPPTLAEVQVSNAIRGRGVHDAGALFHAH